MILPLNKDGVLDDASHFREVEFSPVLGGKCVKHKKKNVLTFSLIVRANDQKAVVTGLYTVPNVSPS